MEEECSCSELVEFKLANTSTGKISALIYVYMYDTSSPGKKIKPGNGLLLCHCYHWCNSKTMLYLRTRDGHVLSEIMNSMQPLTLTMAQKLKTKF